MNQRLPGTAGRAAFRVLILENDGTGHRLQHVRVCTQAIVDLGVEVVLATGASIPGTDEFRTHITPVLDRITLDASLATADRAPSWRAATTRMSEYLAAIRRHRPDHVYTLYADGLAQVAGAASILGGPRLPRSVEWEGILMRGRFAYPSTSWTDPVFARAWLAATSATPIDILHFLDPIPFERVVGRGGRLASKARLIPEPVEPMAVSDRRDARRALGLPLEGRIVCCPGGLDARKGVDRMLRAFRSAAGRLRSDDRLLLIGRVDASIGKALGEARGLIERGRIILREGVVSDADLHRAIAAAHVVAATYPRQVGSSGIVVRAAALERIVLASDYGWLGMVAGRFGLGLTCDCGDDAAIAELLPRVLDASESYAASAAARRFSRFHTEANYVAHLTRRLRQRLGLGDAEPQVGWEWVLRRD